MSAAKPCPRQPSAHMLIAGVGRYAENVRTGDYPWLADVWRAMWDAAPPDAAAPAPDASASVLTGSCGGDTAGASVYRGELGLQERLRGDAAWLADASMTGFPIIANDCREAADELDRLARELQTERESRRTWAIEVQREVDAAHKLRLAAEAELARARELLREARNAGQYIRIGKPTLDAIDDYLARSGGKP